MSTKYSKGFKVTTREQYFQNYIYLEFTTLNRLRGNHQIKPEVCRVPNQTDKCNELSKRLGVLNFYDSICTINTKCVGHLSKF